MSPELFDPEKFDLKDGRQTKQSDCYALGMVVYEVLSGRLPFSRHHGLAIIWAIMKGERPRRSQGKEGVWFTADGIWSVMERCWKPNPGDRPRLEDVLRCLEDVSRSWIPPSPQMIADSPTTNSFARDLDPSTEESVDESEGSSPSQALQERSLQGDPNANSITLLLTSFQLSPEVLWITTASRRV